MSNIDPRAYRVESTSRLIAASNDGEDEARANEAMSACIQSLQQQTQELGPKASAKAKLVIEIDFTLTNGRIEYRVTPEAKLPKPPRGSPEIAFIDADGKAMTLQDPNQHTMFPHANLGRRHMPMADDGAS